MLGRGITTVVIAMMVFVGASFAAHELVAQNSKFSKSYSGLKLEAVRVSSLVPVAHNARMRRQNSASRDRNSWQQYVGKNSEIRYAGVNWRRSADNAKIILATWKNSLIASYQRFPAVVLGLAGLVVLPLLALPGLFLRLARGIKQRLSHRMSPRGQDLKRPPGDEPPTPAGASWIEVEGCDTLMPRAKLDGEMLRIGRERDNDICLDARSVHRYHALVYRTPDQEILITDLSGKNGNGMWVNGTRLQSVVLHHGDRIQLGQVRLKYEMGRA